MLIPNAEKDDADAISKDNIMSERTRHAKPQGGYREPGDGEGIDGALTGESNMK